MTFLRRSYYSSVGCATDALGSGRPGPRAVGACPLPGKLLLNEPRGDQFVDLRHGEDRLVGATGQTSEVLGDLRGLTRLKSSLDGPRGNDLVDLRHEADGLLEGHHDLAAVSHVVVGEGAPLAVAEPPLEHLVAPDVELPHRALDALEALSLVDADATAPGNACRRVS